MPGRTYSPLGLSGRFNEEGKFVTDSSSEYQRFREAAKDGDVLDELIGLTLTSTGLRAGAMSHMRESWLELEGRAQILVPYGESCEMGSGAGRGGDTSKTGEPCKQCRNRVNKNWAPDHADWTPKSENGVRPIPVRDDDTIQILESYFNLHEDVVGIQTVTTRVKKISDRAGIDRKVTAHDLRDTYGTLLAKKNFSPYKIRDLMGHANLEQALDYVKLAGEAVQDEYDQKW